jgi:hypothetical protein
LHLWRWSGLRTWWTVGPLLGCLLLLSSLLRASLLRLLLGCLLLGCLLLLSSLLRACLLRLLLGRLLLGCLLLLLSSLLFTSLVGLRLC